MLNLVTEFERIDMSRTVKYMPAHY